MNSSLPVASLESIYGRRQYNAFLEQYAVDVAIVDVPWNDDLVTHPPEVAVRAHPPKQAR